MDDPICDPGPCVDDLSTANTEDSLLGSRKSTETISTVVAKELFDDDDDGERKEFCYCCRCGPSCTLITGAILTICGISSLIWTPFSILMNERLKMSPPFPPYQWWKNPPDEVLLRVYLFNITNSLEFLNGSATRLAVEEIGPIVFREKLEHYNVSFNENGTLSYVARRSAVFLPEMNEAVRMDDVVYVPNLAVLGMASYLWDASFFTKFLFNVLTRNLRSEMIVKISVKDYLWNNSDPILEVARTLAPSMVPVNNMGILSRIYSNFQDSVTVFIGPEYGHERFFLIDKYDGTENLPGHGDACLDSVVNSTEGVAYAQFLTKDSVLRYWRKTMCRVTPLYYDVEVEKYGVNAFRFALPNNTYNRIKPNDCYESNPVLANGLSDVSKCFFDFPMAASFPHFLYGDDVLKTYVDGLKPKKEAHDSFVIVEPLTGIPMESRARSQSNLVIKNLNGLSNQFHKFSNTIVPMFWAEYNQVGLPFYISALMYFTVQIVRPFQSYFSAILILGGVIMALLGVRKAVIKRSHLTANKALRFEQELFFAKQRHC